MGHNSHHYTSWLIIRAHKPKKNGRDGNNIMDICLKKRFLLMTMYVYICALMSVPMCIPGCFLFIIFSLWLRSSHHIDRLYTMAWRTPIITGTQTMAQCVASHFIFCSSSTIKKERARERKRERGRYRCLPLILIFTSVGEVAQVSCFCFAYKHTYLCYSSRFENFPFGSKDCRQMKPHSE